MVLSAQFVDQIDDGRIGVKGKSADMAP